MKHRSISALYQPIYDEFGKGRTDVKRRELTVELGRAPSYIELYAALCLEDGPDPGQANDVVTQFISSIDEIGAHWDADTETGKVIDETELRAIVGDTPVEIIELYGILILADASDPKRFGAMLAYGSVKAIGEQE